MVIYVDPQELRVPGSRATGADPAKLHRQIAKYGKSAAGMPPIWVIEDPNGLLMITNGVTRAARIAKLAPGTQVPIDVIGRSKSRFDRFPRIGDVLP